MSFSSEGRRGNAGNSCGIKPDVRGPFDHVASMQHRGLGEYEGTGVGWAFQLRGLLAIKIAEQTTVRSDRRTVGSFVEDGRNRRRWEGDDYGRRRPDI